MKADIHPASYITTITCACGNVIQTQSTRQSLKVEICSACHPFFTGQQKLVDVEGRVERFQKKYARAKQVATQATKQAAKQGTKRTT